MAGYLSTVSHELGRVREFDTMEERNAWIVDQVMKEGRSLVDVGRELALTRERIRQIVMNHTGNGRWTRMRQRERKAHREWRAQRRQQVLALRSKFSLGGLGDSGRGLREAAARPLYSNEELLDYLRQWAADHPERCPFGPFIWDTEAVYIDGPPAKFPTSITYRARFGSFHAALEAAGLPLYEEKPTYSNRVSDEKMVQDVMRFLADPNNVQGGAYAYQKWARGTKPPAVQLSTIRSRHNGWLTIKTEAIERMGLADKEALDAYIDERVKAWEAKNPAPPRAFS